MDVMLYRKAYDKLLSWKNGKNKKTALFIEGVRQCVMCSKTLC
jgi:hypothetical protein